MTGPLPADLVLEGGGVKGIALAGAVAVLLEKYEFHRVAGTSAGAIAAALVAAGLDADGVRGAMDRLDYRKVPDDWLPVPGLSEAEGLVAHEGLHPGRYVHDWIRDELAALGVHTFRDLRREDAGADPNLAPEQRYKLVVMATDTTRGRMVRLPWDYPEYGLDPDEQSVADAVRMSMSIPFYFAPSTLTDTRTRKKSTVVDGAVLSNFPIEVFDRTDAKTPRWPTFGVGVTDALDGGGPVTLGIPHVLPVVGLLDAVVATAITARDRTYLALPCVRRRAFAADTSGVGVTDFGVDPATRERLYEAGRQAAQEFLARWNWEEYLRACRGVSAPRTPAAR